jgi:beta-lactamase class A
VACTSLAGRELTSLNAGAASHPASTIKLAILAEAFHAASGSRLALDDRLEVFNRFSSRADGSPYHLDPADDADPGLYASAGGRTTVLELLRHMVGQGSNLAANLLLDRLGADQVTAFMRSLGASELVVRRGVQGLRAYERGLNNSTKAGALQVLLLSLARGELIYPSASQARIGLLLQVRSREGIAELLPEEVSVAHKRGWTEAVYHDAAIVTPPARDP